MAKPTFKPNPIVTKIFDDLDKYREFCVDFGYPFNEATIGDMTNYVFRQHVKQLTGKEPRYNWHYSK